MTLPSDPLVVLLQAEFTAAQFGDMAAEFGLRTIRYAELSVAAAGELPAETGAQAAAEHARFLAFRDRALRLVDQPSSIDRDGKGSVTYADFAARLGLLQSERDSAWLRFRAFFPRAAGTASKKNRSRNVSIRSGDSI